MKLLKVLKDNDFGFEEKDCDLKLREAARAIVMKDDKIALLYVNAMDFYKLPGGGIEAGEDLESALRREVLEESGCEVEIIQELGEIHEYRTHFEQFQKSYCFITQVKGCIGKTQFTESEIEDEFELKWFTLDEAIKLAEGTKTGEYMGKFVQERILVFLREAREVLQ